MKTVVLLTLFVFFLLGALYLTAVASPDLFGPRGERAQLVQAAVERVAGECWDFGKPFLQLALILIIVNAIAKTTGFKWSTEGLDMKWDIRALIAIIVVVAYTLAALIGSGTSSGLKDVALVVIGFYFGGLERIKAQQLADRVKDALTASTVPASVSSAAPAAPSTGGQGEEDLRSQGHS